MMEITKLDGTDERLYPLVGPLVMNPSVLRQNHNFPFRTSEKFTWFIALDTVNGQEQVEGFLPVEKKSTEYVINNYYVRNRDEKVLRTLLNEAIAQTPDDRQLSAICFVEDKDTFATLRFEPAKLWTRYIKMTRKPDPKEHEGA